MPITVELVNRLEGDSIRIEIESDDPVSDIMCSAEEYWKLVGGTFILRRGSAMVDSGATVSGSHISDGDVLEVVPSPM